MNKLQHLQYLGRLGNQGGLTELQKVKQMIANGTVVPTPTQQRVLNYLVYTNQAGTQTYIDPATTTKVCPVGYVAVPGNSMYGTSDFCVAKYQMKAVDLSAPTVGLTTPNTGPNTIANNTTATTSANGRAIASVASGYPIANISQITAIDYCQNQNTVSGGTLITNAEWMTIARNIEGQGVNWTGGVVGNGGLWRGHSDNNPSGALAASTDNDPYFGTNNSGTSIERRTHTLSNGEVIWDMSGNVWEWTSDTILGQDKPNNSSGNLWQQWTAISNFGTLSYDLTRPSNNAWNSSQNMGQYYAGSLTGGPFALLRGGSWNYSTLAGVFTLTLSAAPSFTLTDIGFRCVVR
jgi:formylglycine-generating enzyme required for sulfatase activity